MIRILIILMTVSVGLSACTTGPHIGPDGKPLRTAYRISTKDHGKIQFRMLDSVNALRGSAGVGPVQMDAKLNAAAATHSRDMSIQNRPWHFGSDGSSPIDRINRVGYPGKLVGEVISETYETEIETLGAWMEKPDTRRIIMTPDARRIGFSWYQETNGKIWWTLVMGS